MKIPAYLDYLRQQKCVLCGSSMCMPHHTGSHGTAKRNHDNDAISVCFTCHRQIHDTVMFSKAGLQRKAEEQFEAWLNTLPLKKREKIENKLKEEKR